MKKSRSFLATLFGSRHRAEEMYKEMDLGKIDLLVYFLIKSSRYVSRVRSSGLIPQMFFQHSSFSIRDAAPSKILGGGR